MLVLWGMKDFVFDHHFLDEWVRRFPAAEVHRFPRAGHYLFEDEAVRLMIGSRSFWRPTPSSGSTSVESNLHARGAVEHRSRPERDGREPASHPGRRRPGRARPSRPRPLHAPDLPSARPGQRSDRAWPARDRGSSRHPRRGDGPAGLDFFSLVFALFKAGVVPVLIDPGIGLRNLGRCARGRARGLHRHSQGPLGTSGFSAGARDGPRRIVARGTHGGRGGESQDAGRPAAQRGRRPRNGAATRVAPSPHSLRPRRRRSSSPAAARALPKGPSTPTRSFRPGRDVPLAVRDRAG